MHAQWEQKKLSVGNLIEGHVPNPSNVYPLDSQFHNGIDHVSPALYLQCLTQYHNGITCSINITNKKSNTCAPSMVGIPQ